MAEEEIKYKETNGIPICPHCQKPTKRSGGGVCRTTLMWFEPVYDENGRNTNPDRNTITTTYHCDECDKNYATKGNSTDGYRYA